MMLTPTLRRPLRILLPVTASLWIGALGLSFRASKRIPKLADRTRENREAIRSLDPEMDQFSTYWSTVGTLIGNPESAPQLYEWLKTRHPALLPTSCEEQTSTLERSRVQMRTATATWTSVAAEQLGTIIKTAEDAPASYRLRAITLSPAAKENELKVETVFCAFTQKGNL